MTAQKIVIDTSVIIKWLSSDKEDHLEQAIRILEAALDNELELLAPELAKYEVGNVLLFSKKLSTEQATIVLEQFYTLPITFISESEDLAKNTYHFAFTYGVTYYDAAFMSLAKYYNAILVTENIKHQRKSSEIKVTSLSEY